MRSKAILEKLLLSVNVPFSQYRDTYNRLINAKEPIQVDLKEDSKEATIVENALVIAGVSGRMDPTVALDLLKKIEVVEIKEGRICQGYEHDDKTPTATDSFHLRMIRI